jgi:hypothetical protein
VQSRQAGRVDQSGRQGGAGIQAGRLGKAGSEAGRTEQFREVRRQAGRAGR